MKSKAKENRWHYGRSRLLCTHFHCKRQNSLPSLHSVDRLHLQLQGTDAEFFVASLQSGLQRICAAQDAGRRGGAVVAARRRSCVVPAQAGVEPSCAPVSQPSVWPLALRPHFRRAHVSFLFPNSFQSDGLSSFASYVKCGALGFSIMN